MKNAAITIKIKNNVLLIGVIFSLLPEPIACETRICPAFDIPRQIIVAKFIICPPSDTAESPGVPTYSPTIIISIVLYST